MEAMGSVTPFVADEDFTLYNGDVREVLASLPDESVHCCVTSPPYSDADAVQLFGPDEASLHLGGCFVGSPRSPGVSATLCNTSNLARVFDGAQGQAVLGLTPFDPQIRQKCRQGRGGLHIRLTPLPERTTALCTRIFRRDVSAEGCREQIDGLARDLPNVDSLAVGRLSRISGDSHGVSVALHADRSVRVEDASEVGKHKFVHVSYDTGGR